MNLLVKSVATQVLLAFLFLSSVLSLPQDQQPGETSETEPQAPSSFSESNKAKIDKARQDMTHLKTMVENMKRDSSTSNMIPHTSQSLTTKIRAMPAKWNAQLRDAYAADQEGVAERISGAISGAGAGMVEVANGIKNKDWKAGVKGALTIVSSLVQLAGPVGMIASSVLSFFSSMLDLFGGSGKTESMDDKIERIVKEQIDIGREKDLKAEVEGIKLEFTSISTSLQHFRESKLLERNEANELYNLAFSGLMVFGKLRARIDEICDIDLSKGDSDKQEAAKKCLGIVNILCEVSILRQLILSDIAAVLSDVHGSRTTASGLLVVANNVLNIIKKEQENDAHFLSFVTDPFNNPKRRYIISLFFGAPSKYITLLSYVQTLHGIIPGGMFKNYVMLCQGTYLTGLCNVFTKNNYPNFDEDPKEWKNKAKSLYVPPLLKVTAWKLENFDDQNSKWGPYIGPCAYKLNNGQGEADWDSMKVEDTARDALNEVRICEAASLNPGRCHTLPIGEYNLNDIDGLNFDGKIASMYVPYGFSVSGYTGRDKGGKSYVYYIGEDTINQVFDHTNWRSIRVQDLSNVLRSREANELVQYCSEENLGGKCRRTWININDFETNYGMRFSRVRSIKIPGGLQITGYSQTSKQGSRYGPYTGPALISKLDPIDKWKSMKIEEFGTDLPDSVVEIAETNA